MSCTQYKENKHEAESCVRDDDYVTAGNYYTLCAHSRLSNQFKDGNRSDTVDLIGLSHLLEAGICYLLGNSEERTKNRCRQGVLIAEDLRDYGHGYEAEKGLMWEYIGDYRLFGDFDDYEEAYEKAKTIYEDYDRQQSINWNSENEFYDNKRALIRMVKSAGIPFDREDYKWTKILYEDLTERVDYKTNNYADILRKVIEKGDLIVDD